MTTDQTPEQDTADDTDLAAYEEGLRAIPTDRDLIFLDTETITLTHEPGQLVVWEVYIERHNSSGTIEIAHLYPVHGERLMNLPARFAEDYNTRVPEEPKRTSGPTTGMVLAQMLRRRADNPPPTVVGANPFFDMIRLADYLAAAGATDGSHFRRLDIEAAAYGHLGMAPPDAEGGLVGLTTRFGLPITNAHTAHGDVEMVKNLYLALFTDSREP